ncbi:secreted RxLR effector peptide protein, putative [Phytophthora infestans T30-4]|uniref:RxLR effector protein n=3 Tax=Phytophthora infestans TaxID=4787 RepID=D0NLN4_PHYIT|nr:secreted RxLR effector peptide protein, putative [Phytophthora infestans T30-4]EEY60581.1 secreted RxLR effector peptide protein, putative [Phytophthora infestans T30-4]KAF4037930.1 RXLR domain-containing protein [Phytophthora infestans]KAF4150213.1 RXLR effector domain-containing protein [Phytophthora infestans]KAF4150223.1 RXLR effector domain-containing protein [Phytophthora infestans]|eukprot:XP_002899954.1 secreted RxLR effector peptide protein, putative [Phytophthora infestans T30-4]
MHLSYVVLVAIVALSASTEVTRTALANSVQTKTSTISLYSPTTESYRFLRARKNEDASDEERGISNVARIKEKIFKLKMKIAMPSIKKVLAGVVGDLFK